MTTSTTTPSTTGDRVASSTGRGGPAGGLTGAAPRVWTPRSTNGGQHAGACAEHPGRRSVWKRQGGTWIDTGLCQTDVNRIERADRAIARVAAANDRQRAREARIARVRAERADITRIIRDAARVLRRTTRRTHPDAIVGEVGRSRSRITRTTAIVVDANIAGADANVDPGEARWWVICDPHGGLVTTPTRRLAFSAAVDPSEWCPTCQEARA